jgi:enoyl-CoA hydratase/carnithine racemase
MKTICPYNFTELKVHVMGGVAILTMNRPHRKNALTPTLVNELIVALEWAGEDAGVGAVILTGEGEVFCSGADLKEMRKGPQPPAEGVPSRGGFVELNLAFTKIGKPTIAKVRGLALAGGLGLMAACTFAISEEKAIFGTPEIHRGIFPMMIMANIFRLVPRRLGLELILMGNPIDAQQARDWGLLNRVVAPSALDEEVFGFAAALANRPPNTMRIGLEAFYKQSDMSVEEALPWLETQLFACLTTPDATEGVMAFLEKREPDWAKVRQSD